jgi:flagellar protein FlgJ
MSLPMNSASVYTDLQGLDRLRYAADKNSPETLRYVAQQFEAIFLQMMLKSARGDEGSGEEGLFDSQQSEFYQDWHDKQLAIDLAAGQGIGIADMLVKQLQVHQGMKASDPDHPVGRVPASALPRAASKSAAVISAPENQTSASLSGQSSPQASVQTSPQATTASATVAKASPTFASPREFTEQLWPMAKQVAAKLGVAPELLVAQAALETGWGKKIAQLPDASSSYNLFNIKADQRWSGDRVVVPTLEYRDGVAVRENAQFRAYPSFEASFEDYARFIQDSPRYQSALDVAADSQAFVQHLSQAGYATDPQYASKIMRIAQSEPMQSALDAIKVQPS